MVSAVEAGAYGIDVLGSDETDEGTAPSAFAALQEAASNPAANAIAILRSIVVHDAALQPARRGTSVQSRRYLESVIRQYGTSAACVLVATLLLVACAGSSPEAVAPVREPAPAVGAADRAIDDLVAAGRVDLAPTGNRVIDGRGALFDAEPFVVEARTSDAAVMWIAPTSPSDWLIVYSDGSVYTVSTTAGFEAVTEQVQTDPFDPAPGPPLVVEVDGEAVIEAHDARRSLFTDPLPDTRVTTDGSELVAIGGPTERYPHGALGDDLEGSTIEVVDADGASRTPVMIDDPDVFEAVSPMLADVDGDGAVDAVMTVSNADTGARLVAYDLADGSIVGESEPIGQGNRWRNLLAVAPTGPGGETEIIDIRTPHIGGTLQFFQFLDGRLEQVASADTYSTHRIGSRNLDLGIVTDADGDGRLDVLLPTQDMTALAVVTRDAGGDTGTLEVGRVELGAEITSNLAATVTDRGVAYAVGLSDGTIRFWLP